MACARALLRPTSSPVRGMHCRLLTTAPPPPPPPALPPRGTVFTPAALAALAALGACSGCALLYQHLRARRDLRARERRAGERRGHFFYAGGGMSCMMHVYNRATFVLPAQLLP